MAIYCYFSHEKSRRHADLFSSTLDTAHCAQRRPQRRRDRKKPAFRQANFESAWAFLREGQKSELDYPDIPRKNPAATITFDNRQSPFLRPPRLSPGFDPPSDTGYSITTLATKTRRADAGQSQLPTRWQRVENALDSDHAGRRFYRKAGFPPGAPRLAPIPLRHHEKGRAGRGHCLF